MSITNHTNTENKMNPNKIITPDNLGAVELRGLVEDLREVNRNTGRSWPLTLIGGAYMIATQPEFKGDPRPALVPAETAEYMRSMLERAGVDVDHSIDIALARTGAVA
ncbi:hypothetical protein ACVU7I_01810 [Patulibacter sp. S7RM1-6]